MKEIKLTRGFVTLVDDEDFQYLNQFKWYAFKNHNRNYYAARRKTNPGGTSKTVFMHREIINPSIGNQVDHKSRNSLDNTRANLRECTPAQNSMNKKNQNGSKSQYKGVTIFGGKWKAQITCNNKGIYLGLFTSEALAALAYDNKAKELFGEFANLNFK